MMSLNSKTVLVFGAALFIFSQNSVLSFSPLQNSLYKSLPSFHNLLGTTRVHNHDTGLYAFERRMSETIESTKLEAYVNPADEVQQRSPNESIPAPPSYTEQFSSFVGDEYSRGLLVCTIITIVFSSNSPALHTAFASVGTPPPALLVNALISCIALTGIALGGPLLDAVMPAPSSLERNQESDKEEDPNAPVKAGLELGLWKGLGTTANVFGLSMTTANHAAFLIQLTTLLVPVIQSFMGYEMSKKIWLSVGLALSGVFLFTQEATAVGAASNQALGDALCLVAAVFYAGYDIRCFEWGKQVPARELITNKIATQAFLSLLLLVGAGWDQAHEFYNSFSSAFATTFANDPSSLFLLVACILWSGLTVNSLAPFVQVSAQQAIGPTKAQTIYASQPMWAALLSFFFLGETVGLQGLVGGGAFVSALFLAATSEKDPATIIEEED
jgi:drug/metabolite transporter (DMT)-like permease